MQPCGNAAPADTAAHPGVWIGHGRRSTTVDKAMRPAVMMSMPFGGAATNEEMLSMVGHIPAWAKWFGPPRPVPERPGEIFHLRPVAWSHRGGHLPSDRLALIKWLGLCANPRHLPTGTRDMGHGGATEVRKCLILFMGHEACTESKSWRTKSCSLGWNAPRRVNSKECPDKK